MLLSGCYLGHLAAGQARLLHAARPIEQVLGDPATDASLREALAQVGPALGFARRLGLEVGRQYRTYAAWPGDRVVTSVVATRPASVEPAGFWFPVVGRVPYKGFFDPGRAAREARRLAGRGLDVCVIAVPAYSTLGWLADPVTGPMVRHGVGPLVETLIHELVHATVFVAGDADWNEGIATFIGQEGSVRFFEASAGAETARRERERVEDERAVARVLAGLRERVAALYAGGDGDPAPARGPLAEVARAEIAALPLRTRPASHVAAEVRLNDACLALAGTYERDLDAYAVRLDAMGGDLVAFVAQAREAARDGRPREAFGLGPPPP